MDFRSFICLLFLSLSSCSTAQIQMEATELPVQRLQLNGGPRGIFDPSLEADPETQRVWMTYSSVEKPFEKAQDTISTRLAYTTDKGKSWNSGALINPVRQVKTEQFPSASWNSEVSSLVYDPHAPREQRWKMMWHHYLIRHDTGPFTDSRKFEHGWIGYKEAASPEALGQAAEVKLFVTKAYKDVNDTLHGETDSPVGGPGKINLSADLHKDLSQCLVLSEPGLMSTPEALYLSVSCYYVAFGLPLLKIKNALILLKCENPCRASEKGAWKYVNTMIDSDQAEKYGYKKFSAPSLVKRGENFFMWASPVSNEPFNDSYNGCVLFQFSDLKSGVLVKKEDLPTPIRFVRTKAGTFNGACDEESALENKIYIGEVFPKSPEMFQLFTAPLN